jgi:hypothetical protein
MAYPPQRGSVTPCAGFDKEYGMNTPAKRLRTFVLLGALAALVCACQQRSASEQQGAPAALATKAGPTPSPALWEPVDKNFIGCEGG